MRKKAVSRTGVSKTGTMAVIATLGAAITFALAQATSVPSGKSTEGAMNIQATAMTTTSATSLVVGLKEVGENRDLAV